MIGPFITTIRGAICVVEDSPDLIEAAACKLYARLLTENSIDESAIACLLITQASDLKTRNPATGLRKAKFCAAVPLFCMQELEIEGMLERVIRMLIVMNRPQNEIQHVFLDGAEKLRPDLSFKPHP